MKVYAVKWLYDNTIVSMYACPKRAEKACDRLGQRTTFWQRLIAGLQNRLIDKFVVVEYEVRE